VDVWRVKDLAIEGVGYRLVAVAGDDRWVAYARRADNGDRFGVECAASTEREALELLERWLLWQSEHRRALEALQSAERRYHRTVAGGAFADAGGEPAAVQARQASLEEVDAARVLLDRVRARKPEC
jgi:hypothetical protein